MRLAALAATSIVASCALVYGYDDYEPGRRDAGIDSASGGVGLGGTGASAGSWGGFGAADGAWDAAGSGGSSGSGGSDAIDSGPDVCVPKCPPAGCGDLPDGCGGTLTCNCVSSASCVAGVCVESVELLCGPTAQCQGGWTELQKIASIACDGTCPNSNNAIICGKDGLQETNGFQSSCIKGHEGLKVNDCIKSEDFLACVKD